MRIFSTFGIFPLFYILSTSVAHSHPLVEGEYHTHSSNSFPQLPGGGGVLEVPHDYEWNVLEGVREIHQNGGILEFNKLFLGKDIRDVTIGRRFHDSNFKVLGIVEGTRGIKLPDGNTIKSKAELKGEKGDQGTRGARGAKGEKGDRGATGPRGADGAGTPVAVCNANPLACNCSNVQVAREVIPSTGGQCVAAVSTTVFCNRVSTGCCAICR